MAQEFLAPVLPNLVSALELPNVRAVRIAVAYVHAVGFGLIVSSLEACLRRGARVEVICDCDRVFTDPRSLEKIAGLSGDLELRVYAPRVLGKPDPPFHAKVYSIETDVDFHAFVGSANLTSGGLRDNREATVHLASNRRDRVAREIRVWFRRLWRSPALIAVSPRSTFLRAYEQRFKEALGRRKEIVPRQADELEPPLELTTEDVTAIREKRATLQKKERFGPLAYLLGLICAGGKAFDEPARSINIELQRGILNRGSRFEGRIHFPGKSTQNLDQRKCVANEARRILAEIREARRRLSPADRVTLHPTANSLRFLFRLDCSSSSTLWLLIQQQALHSAVPKDGRYVLPAGINLRDPISRRDFLRGYFDLRLRLAGSDALPNGLLRAAISIGVHAENEFVSEMRKLIAEEFRCSEEEINVLKGASRHRETIVRFDPRIVPTSFLRSPWQQIVIKDFQAYNNQFDS